MSFAVLDERFVRDTLTNKRCFELMKDTLAGEDRAEYLQFERKVLTFPDKNKFGIMPCWNSRYYGVKLIGLYPENPLMGYAAHQGQILLFDSGNGRLLACIDCGSVTEIRTAAVSAVASSLLARPSSAVLSILGCGAQGRSHLKAFLELFPLERIYLWDRRTERAERLASEIEAGPVQVCVCTCIEQAVKDSDIICTLTGSKEPLLYAKWLKPGVHINAVGACSPSSRELSGELVSGCEFFCDSAAGVRRESGDYLIPLAEGDITDTIIRGTIGELLNGKIAGRSSQEAITVFESLGMAAEDVAAAGFLYDRWLERNER